MKKQEIKEEEGIHKQWYKDAKIQTLETLPEFMRHLAEDYSHDYGTICHAIGASAIAAAWAMDNSPNGGITGFQAGAIMWCFIQNWSYSDNKYGLKILDMDKLLYPQYGDIFNTISENTWKSIQKEAQNNLDSETDAHPDVVAHWKSIVDGNIPFGLTIKEL